MPKLLAFNRPFILQPHQFQAGNSSFAKRNFFLSFSDALRCIFEQFKISGQAEYILVPNFYCPDTLQFISQFCKLAFYRVNNDFSLDKDSYFSCLEKFRPRVIVNYSFTGFSLSPEERQRLKNLINQQTIIIDDFAHGLLSVSVIDFISPNHFYLDSIRKHSPFLGSHLVNQNFVYQAKTVKHFSLYKIELEALQLIKGLVSYLAYIFRANWLYRFYDQLFLWQDKFIGSNNISLTGWASAFYLYNLIDLDKLREHQKKLASCYNLYFNKLNNQSIKTLSQEIVQSAKLAYYPLFIEEFKQEPLINFLKKRNIFIEKLWEAEELDYPELNRGLYNSFLIFPLTWLIKEEDVATIAKAVKDFLISYEHKI